MPTSKPVTPPAAPPSETREELARRIIKKLAESAIGLAVCRHDLQPYDEIEQLPPEDLCDELVRDVVNCMTGDDPGCLSDEELNDPERVDLPWLIRELQQAARASAPTQAGATEAPLTPHGVACEIARRLLLSTTALQGGTWNGPEVISIIESVLAPAPSPAEPPVPAPEEPREDGTR